MKLRVPAAVIPALLILLLPAHLLGLESLPGIQQRMLAIFVMAVSFWILEPIPIFATSILLIFAEVLLISSQSLLIFRGGPEAESLIAYTRILQTFASPIIMLFLGGFFLAIAATKYRLDINLARVLLKPFGNNPRWIMLGLMFITGTFSMFMSNTATTALMLAILSPVLRGMRDGDPGRIAFVLSIPIAANIGGVGTPIGTPPNAVAMKYLVGSDAITFAEWMSFGIPLSVVIMMVAWMLLLVIFPPQEKEMELAIKGEFQTSWQAWIVYVIFASTILLWLTGKLHGLNSYVVALLPVAVFLAFRIITKEDLKLLSWDVLWLISGGIALGLGLEETGLSKTLVEVLPFSEWPALTVLVGSAVIALLMSTFISNTATANLLLPLMAALGSSQPALQQLGGTKAIVLINTFACSMAMALPVSTPPNALAFASGMLKGPELMKAGALVSILGLLVSFVAVWLMRLVGFV
jgi:sodium-dependent dicarboxylate transporter 2/3/5